MKPIPTLTLTLLLILITSCNSLLTTGNTVPMGPEQHPRTSAEQVMILFDVPARPHDSIGIVSALGGMFTDEGRMYQRLQIEAAKLGADAVIVRPTAPTSGLGYPKNSGTAIKYQ